MAAAGELEAGLQSTNPASGAADRPLDESVDRLEPQSIGLPAEWIGHHDQLKIEWFVSLLQKIAYGWKINSPQPGCSGSVDDLRSIWRGRLFARRRRLASLIEDSTKLSIIGARSAEQPKRRSYGRLTLLVTNIRSKLPNNARN
jgi:hypothetical protein